MRLPLLDKNQQRQEIDKIQTDELSELIERIKDESRIGKYEDSGAHARGLYSLGKPWLYDDSFSHRLLRVRLLERSLSNAAIRAVNITTQEVFPSAQFDEDNDRQLTMIISEGNSYTTTQNSCDRAVNIHYALAFTSRGRLWGSYRRDYSHRRQIGENHHTGYEARVAAAFYREQTVTAVDMDYLLDELSVAIALEKHLRDEREI